MKQIEAYICEHCNDKLTLTTDKYWLAEHELYCDENPFNKEHPYDCKHCKNGELSHYARYYDGYHKRYYQKPVYVCSIKYDKHTSSVCLGFKDKEAIDYD